MTYQDQASLLHDEVTQLKHEMEQIRQSTLRSEDLYEEQWKATKIYYTEERQWRNELLSGRSMVQVAFALCFLFGLWVAFEFWVNWGAQESAPQQAAVAAYAAAKMIIAYVLARSVEKMVRKQ